MMYWLAEAAGIPAETLDRAEEAAKVAAARVGHDHPSHGKAMRAVLPWCQIEKALEALPPLSAPAATAAEAAVARAHAKLVARCGKRYS